jgi:uncharacterized protein (TIRG00374 family)
MPGLVMRQLKFTAFLGLGILLLWLATHHLNQAQRNQITEAFRHADYRALIPALIAGTASHVVRSLRWRLLIRPLNYNPSLVNILCAVMIGYLSNLALPRLGEITRCGVVARYEKIPATKVIGTMIAERSVDLISLLLLLLLTVVFQLRLMGHFFVSQVAPKETVTGHKNLLLIVLAAVAVLAALSAWAMSKFRHTMMYVRFRLLLMEVWEGLRTIGHMPDKIWFLGYTFLLWILYFFMVYFGFFCLRATSHLGLGAGLSVLSFGSIGMILTQGGIGAYQLIVQHTLTRYGIAAGTAYASGWIIWLAQTLLVVLLGFISVILLPFINRPSLGQMADHQPKDPNPG